jgi:hypothetical protein
MLMREPPRIDCKRGCVGVPELEVCVDLNVLSVSLTGNGFKTYAVIRDSADALHLEGLSKTGQPNESIYSTNAADVHSGDFL